MQSIHSETIANGPILSGVRQKIEKFLFACLIKECFGEVHFNLF